MSHASGPPKRIRCQPRDIAETKRAQERKAILYLCTTYDRDDDYRSPLQDCSFYLFRNDVWSASPFDEKWTSEQSEGKDPLLVDYIRDKAKALPARLNWRDRDPFLVKEAEEDYGPARHRAHLITLDSNVGARVTPAAWQQAEYLCASALRQFGFDDARITESGPDGGVDILGSTIAAQVKYTNRPVGRPLVQQLIGAAGGSVTAFFSLAGFSAQATECAGEAAMALFVVRLPCTIIPWNDVSIPRNRGGLR
ncbi:MULTISPECIES: restriction endonuclease [Micromonospora]|uniref:restriction endonuclease n=1 Tax=Micromonospora TaxID=1873 RepID=UPI001319C71A|nr:MULTISPECIES: restriction endonuclease [Micromonospora]NES14598.1 restriction endonuclease [Micromonospora sp. PPF5-17B]NES35264.1 restriction endonuclease [Micromonospora solifontis]